MVRGQRGEASQERVMLLAERCEVLLVSGLDRRQGDRQQLAAGGGQTQPPGSRIGAICLALH